MSERRGTPGLARATFVGSLIEGIGTAIAAQIPPERQGEVAVEAVRLLRDRMRIYNVI
jgi:hypothetical protein